MDEKAEELHKGMGQAKLENTNHIVDLGEGDSMGGDGSNDNPFMWYPVRPVRETLSPPSNRCLLVIGSTPYLVLPSGSLFLYASKIILVDHSFSNTTRRRGTSTSTSTAPIAAYPNTVSKADIAVLRATSSLARIPFHPAQCLWPALPACLVA
jgi:hypothetical protein